MDPDTPGLLASFFTVNNSSSGASTANPTVAHARTLAVKKLDQENSSIVKLKQQEQLTDNNWSVWWEHVCCIFLLCGADPYIYGTIPCPDPVIDPDVADIWDKNDIYAQILITGNITEQQMVPVSCLNTVHEIWHSLEAIHKTHNHQVAIAIQCALFSMHANKTDDITDHLT